MPIKRTTTTSDDFRMIYRFATTPGHMSRAIPLIKRIKARRHCWLTPEEEAYLTRVEHLHQQLEEYRKRR